MKFDLFKNSKPIIRDFVPIGETAGDVPYIWDAYKKGIFGEIPDNLSMAEFIEFSNEFQLSIEEMNIVEDKINGEVVPVGLIVAKNNGWVLEPHILWFDNVTKKAVYRIWVGFLKKTKYRTDIGACLIRVEKQDRNFLNHLETMGLIEYVGKIWGGRPHGNEYLYSVRCGRKSPPIIIEPNVTRH